MGRSLQRSMHHCQQEGLGMISMAIAGAVGNMLYLSPLVDNGAWISASFAPWMLIIARVVCGLEGATICLFQIALLSTSRGPKSRAANMADLTLASSIGMMLGPVMSSVTRLIA